MSKLPLHSILDGHLTTGWEAVHAQSLGLTTGAHFPLSEEVALGLPNIPSLSFLQTTISQKTTFPRVYG